MWFIQPKAVQAAASIGFQVVHDSFGASIPFDDYVYMSGAYMGG